MRSFARLLGLSPSTVSEVLNGKKIFGASTAQKVVKTLQMPALKGDLFCQQVALARAKTPAERQKAQGRIKQLQVGRDRQRLTLDQFSFIADWHHFAIMELLTTEAQFRSGEEVGKRLGLRTLVAEEALTRLLRLGLITKGPEGWTLVKRNNDVVGGTPSSALREYYRQLLDKAREALANQSLEERDFSGYVFAIPREKVTLAKKLLAQYLSDFDKQMSREQGGDAVYCMTTQLFRLDQDQRQLN